MGFVRVKAEDVPAAKWLGYDKRRQARLAVFKRQIAAARADLAPPPAAPAPQAESADPPREAPALSGESTTDPAESIAGE
jgi:hypothetical protein